VQASQKKDIASLWGVEKRKEVHEVRKKEKLLQPELKKKPHTKGVHRTGRKSLE